MLLIQQWIYSTFMHDYLQIFGKSQRESVASACTQQLYITGTL
jgi:hypothetical protein